MNVTLFILVLCVGLACCWRVVAELLLYAAAEVVISDCKRARR